MTLTEATIRPALPAGVGALYDWAVAQLRVPEAHAITRGHRDVVVAIIDLGYSAHPAHQPHLWRDPHPQHGGGPGWDFDQDDGTLEYDPLPDDSEAKIAYGRNHQAFLTGEVAAVAPDCPIMELRAGYTRENGGGWAAAIRYAADNGARVIVIPSLYHARSRETGVHLIFQGTDWSYPVENPAIFEALDYAYERGCLIFRGVADNRNRRVAQPQAAVESIVAVGSTGKKGGPSDNCPSADYTEVAAPGGDRWTGDEGDKIWGTGGSGAYVPFTGGCMASAFAGGVAALIMSRYPHLRNHEVRQVLRNTARGTGWSPQLGHGVLDALAAVSLEPAHLRPGLRVHTEPARVERRGDAVTATLRIENTGALDVRRALVIVYGGDPTRPVDPAATAVRQAEITRRQLGHTIVPLVGLEASEVIVPLDPTHWPADGQLWVQVSALDVGCAGVVATERLAEQLTSPQA
jgi:hypothetical protein